MEQGRLLGNRRKPRLVLPNRQFSFVDDLELGQEGQIDAAVQIDAMMIEPDDDGTEFIEASMTIVKAEPINLKGARM